MMNKQTSWNTDESVGGIDHSGDDRRGLITLSEGNIFDSDAATIVITVNCVGVMGKGIALEFKERYPHLFSRYVDMCEDGTLRPGRPNFITTLIPPSFIMFPTKDHWRSVSRLSDIETGLDYLKEQCTSWGLKSLAVPPLGCGHGGLEWAVVGPVLYKGLARLDIPVCLYPPNGISASSEEMRKLQTSELLTSNDDLSKARRTSSPEVVAVIQALDLSRRMRPRKAIGRVLLQKMGYFAHVAGIPLSFKFERRTFGPYSAEWNAQLRHLVNNGLLNETRVGKREAFSYTPGPSYDTYVEQLSEQVQVYGESAKRLARLMAQLSSSQAELAATTHMVATQLENELPHSSLDDRVIEGVQEWKSRRSQPFPAEQIKSCLVWLRDEGWLDSPQGDEG